MTIPRTSLAVLAAFALTGCSGTDTDTARPASTAARTASTPRTSASAAPSRTPSSAFCLDLTTFQVGVTIYRGDVGKALQGQSLDFTELRRKAAIIAHLGA